MLHIQKNLNNIFKDYKFNNNSLEFIQRKIPPRKIHTYNFLSDDYFKKLLTKTKFKSKNTFKLNTNSNNNNNSISLNNNVINQSDMIINVTNKNIPSFFDNFNIFKIKNNEPIFVAFCILINNNLYFSKDSVKAQFMEKLKNTLAIQFEQYKSNYKFTKINKPEFLNQLLSNKPILNVFFYRYLSDYFNINFINYNIDNKNTIFYNDFLIYRPSLIIFSDDKNIYIQRNNTSISLIGSQELLSKLNIKKPAQRYLLKLSLPELQKLAIDKGLVTTKKGKNNTKNKTKNELIEEISQL